MSWPLPIRVVGVGSPLGDDTLAWEVVRRLQQQDWGSAVEFHTLEGGQRLLDVLDGQGSLVLIDALAPARSPGTTQRLEWPDARLEVLRPGSTHHLQPAEALRLAAALGLLPTRVVIWGMEGKCFDPSSALSPAVAAVLPELEQRIIAELKAVLYKEKGHHA